MNYVTGTAVRKLREQNGLTQKQLAGLLHVSDKTVSKWETNRGLPDISLLTELAAALKVSVAELLAGEAVANHNRSSNMRKCVFYVCPVCGNVILSIGRGSYSCCGITLPELEPEEPDGAHEIRTEIIDNEFYLSVGHEMSKSHFIAFFAYVTSDRAEFVKLYPEQSAECRFSRRGHGVLYAYCNRHGLYAQKV
jgi:DNA-binding XRE family transcriptional regulator/desulfoferrodoxin (superoxide reductase-like protein)